jgi:thioredoxin 1
MLMGIFRKPVPPSPNIVHVSDEAEFAPVTSKGVCLVDFYADWCGPCRSLAPTINVLADEFKGRAKVLKINVDEFPGLAGNYASKGIPTVLIMRDGQVVERIVGARSAGVYRTALEKLLPEKP